MNELISDDQQELLNIEQAWVQAHCDMDFQKIREILDDDYTQLKSDGTLMDKQALLADYSTGKRRWEIAVSEPIKVQMVGDIGLLYGKWRGKGENHHQPFDYDTYFLAVYRKRDAVWKLLADASLVQGE